MRKFIAIIIPFILYIGIGVFGFVMYNIGRTDMLKEINERPSAMDVYQGKTALQYTTVDGEKIDSVVVFKN